MANSTVLSIGVTASTRLTLRGSVAEHDSVHHEAYQVSDAIPLIRHDGVDVIVVDVMQAASGLKSIDQLRTLGTDIPIIALIRADAADVAIEAIRRGSFDCVSIPCETATLSSIRVRDA